ncbi:phage tail tape measure C-terminal domain-containing protein [Corallococcus sicarius]|uniref:Bacteriophage tail tape measure C-terminal domain-containing protein n=1 Tax=Corallococcus sicarius TaxID=2316726 RepID=A0A3A8NWD5_9BACT|nr:phage tail tape measure C-terminal domain-containing protein [Corallococcus sicarius]RKH48393.1 hypothetical protein D7X12_00190 [Corallococcus sicarius]
MDRLQDQINTGFSYTKEIVGTATQHMADTFANFVTTGRLEFGVMVDGILKDLARLMAQKGFVALVDAGLSAIGGGSTSSLSLGGAHAAGGPSARPRLTWWASSGRSSSSPAAPAASSPTMRWAGPNVNQTIHVTVNADGSSQVSASVEGGRAEAERLGKRMGTPSAR